MKKFDLAVLGGGPGGYVAAIRAAQGGKLVALIEATKMGGTCLNRGCIPTKTLLANAAVLRTAREAKDFGVITGDVTFDYSKMFHRKETVVSGIRKSLEGLIKANKITIFNGYGRFNSRDEIKIQGEDNCIIQATQTIIATGSEPLDIPAFPFDHKKILSSTSALELDNLPKRMVIVGGGVIGCEFASMFHDFGVEIEIVEMLPNIIATEGTRISSALHDSFTKRGIKIHVNSSVTSIDTKGSGLVVHLANESTIKSDMALVSVGRKLNSNDLGLEKAGVHVTDRGVITVNERMETSVKGIYAIGDVTAKWLLAHVASHQGLVAADNVCGLNKVMHYNAVPAVTFTRPEIGSVGLTLEKAIGEGHNASLAVFPFQVLGKAQASMETEGFAQIIYDKVSGQIFGAQVIGHEASVLIAEMTLAVANELTLESITETIHAHPTIAEIWMEAALMASDSPLHFPPKAKKKPRKNEALNV